MTRWMIGTHRAFVIENPTTPLKLTTYPDPPSVPSALIFDQSRSSPSVHIYLSLRLTAHSISSARSNLLVLLDDDCTTDCRSS